MYFSKIIKLFYWREGRDAIETLLFVIGGFLETELAFVEISDNIPR